MLEMRQFCEIKNYIITKFELNENSEIFLLNTFSSNLLFLVQDENEKYIVKCYHSNYLFHNELYVLLKYNDPKLEIPQIVYFEDEKCKGLNFIIYKYINGNSLFSIKNVIPVKQLSEIFFEIGEFLHRFHNFELIKDVISYDNQIQNIINETEWSISLIDYGINNTLFEDVIKFVRNSYCLLETVNDYTFTVQDFSDKHILLTKKTDHYTVSGVIDFEMVCFSNKYNDFVLLYISYFLENELTESSFWKGYGSVLNSEKKNLIAFFMLKYALNLCGVSKNVNTKVSEIIMQKVFKWLYNNH